MLQEIILQDTAELRLHRLIESIRGWWLKKFSKKKENYFLIH